MSGQKIEDAKKAAIAALKKSGAPGTRPQETQPVDPLTTVISTANLTHVQKLEKFRELLGKLKGVQAGLGDDLTAWVKNRTATRQMSSILDQCEELLKGFSLDNKNALQRQLNPLVEKMHLSVVSSVNQKFKGGLLYAIPGKTAVHPDFGGFFSMKPSDHDAVYIARNAQMADDAKEAHLLLSEAMYGKRFPTRTELCLESGERLLKSARTRGEIAEAFRGFTTTSSSNNDAMRTVSGRNWCGDYIQKAGKVYVPDTGQMADLSSDVVRNRLGNMGFDLAGDSLTNMKFGLGAVSDFERQYMLNFERALQSGENMQVKSVLLKGKYAPRLREALREITGINAADTPYASFLNRLESAAAEAKGGGLPASTLDSEFDDFAQYVRREIAKHQQSKFAELMASTAPGDKARAMEVFADTQGAFHNYNQMRGVDVVDDLEQAMGSFGAQVRQEFQDNPFLTNEPNLQRAVQHELAGTTPAGRQPGVVIGKQGLKDYIKQHPVAATVQVGMYVWIGKNIHDLLEEGKYDEAVKLTTETVGAEAASRLMDYAIFSKLGYQAGAGGLVTMTGMISYSLAKMGTEYYLNRKYDEASMTALTGYEGGKKREGFRSFLDSAGLSRDEDQVLSQLNLQPGEYQDGSIRVTHDDAGNITVSRRETVPAQRFDTREGPISLPERDVWHPTVYNKADLLANESMKNLYQDWRAEFNAGLANGDIPISQTGEAVYDDFSYVDKAVGFIPERDIELAGAPGEPPLTVKYKPEWNEAEFFIPNTGKMNLREFTFYRQKFDKLWGDWSLTNQFDAQTMYKTKWRMLRKFMENVMAGKQRNDQRKDFFYNQASLDQLELLKTAVGQRDIYIDGKKMTREDIQKIIDRKKADIEDLSSLLPPGTQIEEATEVPGLGSGLVEFGVMPYSGGCKSAFYLFPAKGFSQDYDKLKEAINSLSSGGSTPMSPAIYQAAFAIQAYGTGPRGTIILLCDGQNSCSENPVEAADRVFRRLIQIKRRQNTSWRRIFSDFQLFPSLYADTPRHPGFAPVDMNDAIPTGRENMPITVSTVGFQVSSSQQRILDEVARAGGGISASAENMAQLTQAFSSAIQQASRITPVAPVAGGGGSPVIAASKQNWIQVFVIFFLLGSMILAVAILAVRRHRGKVPSKLHGRLDVFYSNGDTKSFEIKMPRISIGRSPDSSLVINDTEVSSRHAAISMTREGFLLKDLESVNGTYLNGKRISEGFLYLEDVITVGATKLIFKN
ncbi:FHA domain-containing protein [Acidobacteriota bacterium]